MIPFSVRPGGLGCILGSLILLATASSLAACNSVRNSDPLGAPKPLQLRDLAKSDIGTVAEVHLHETMNQLQALMVKLYRRNPRELEKNAGMSMRHRVQTVFDGAYVWDLPELRGKRGTDCIQLAFEEAYKADRVLAFVAGLTSMILASYNDKTEFFLLDELDPQKLYNSARNVEIAVWKLANDRDQWGEFYLLSNSLGDEDRNLSFERLFGKIIAQQDILAKIVADRTNRTIRHIVQRLVGAVFLPI